MKLIVKSKYSLNIDFLDNQSQRSENVVLNLYFHPIWSLSALRDVGEGLEASDWLLGDPRSSRAEGLTS